ncbi:uncharacterized protein LOC135848853 [Planococcus citri]|uniref:uncharacterized protein LOC135848853 n=1 Tax=Planococcus citri TaxID=170843 RepID=UPI0031F8FF9D
MNVVNEDVVLKILTSKNANAASKITLLKWHIKGNIIKAGNNHMSEVYRLTIDYLKNCQPQTRILFVKVPSNSPMYEAGSKWDVFTKELVMYTEILPQIYAFEDDYFTARYYHVDEKHTLFLKDLSQTGYKTGNRTQQLDFQHCAYALRCLAKFHGLSVHLEKTKGLPEVILKDLFYNFHNDDEDTRKQIFAGLTQFYDFLDPAIRSKYADKIEFFKTIEWTEVVADIVPENSSFNVLNHGDYWTNNVMFKYDKFGIIKKAKMLDFQLCRWSNPANDLIYFTITSMRYETYEQYFDLLCSIYLETLNNILAKFDYPTYEMEDLKKDIESRFAFCFVVISCILPIMVSDPDIPVNINEVFKNNESDATALHETLKHKEYLKIATKWFEHFAKKDMSKFETKPIESLSGNAHQHTVHGNQPRNKFHENEDT